MNTILVPLDGSALAERVLPHVRGLASLLGAKVCLFQSLWHVGSDDIMAESLLGAYGIAETTQALQERKQRAWETMRRHAEGYLAAQASYLQAAGLDVEVEVNFGEPARMIVEVAHGRHAMLIAMATHGYGGLKRWTLGSVTDKVVHTATTPVFVIRGAEAPAAAVGIRRILVPLDGSALGRQALPFATELAARTHAELILLEVVDPMIEAYPGVHPLNGPQTHQADILAGRQSQAMQELAALADNLREQGITATPVTMPGYPAEAIVDQADWHAVDMIVMATHGYSGIKRWALGSVADKVLHAATIPVALVRAQANEIEVGANTETSRDVMVS